MSRACQCPLANLCSKDLGPFRRVERQQHSILFVEGEELRHVYLIRRGTVSLHRMSSENRALGRTRALRQEGSFLGAEAVLAAVYQYSARAETQVVLCVSTRERFLQWLGDPTSPGNRVLQAVLQADDEVVPQLSGPDGSAQERVTSWLLDSDQTDENRTGVARNVIAELLGMRAETLSRVLHNLHDEGLIELSRNSLQVVDRGGLHKKLPR